jgi:prephenate dehydratase
MTVSGRIRAARKVVYQGEPGSYSHLACTEALPHCEAVPAATFEDAFVAIRNQSVDLGLIPIENSLHGRITDIHHLLPDETIYIVGEHFHRVRHQLMAVEGASLQTIKTVVSQEPALGQVRKTVTLCAVASRLAAEIHGLNILKPDIEDADHNVTRFLIMSPEPDDADDTGEPVITTFIFRVRNVPAALYKALGGFATNGVNITKLESYQLGGSFYATQFYADISGHPEERNVRLALEELQFFTSTLKVLGVYPAHPFRLEDKNSG